MINECQPCVLDDLSTVWICESSQTSLSLYCKCNWQFNKRFSNIRFLSVSFRMDRTVYFTRFYIEQFEELSRYTEGLPTWVKIAAYVTSEQCSVNTGLTDAKNGWECRIVPPLFFQLFPRHLEQIFPFMMIICRSSAYSRFRLRFWIHTFDMLKPKRTWRIINNIVYE